MLYSIEFISDEFRGRQRFEFVAGLKIKRTDLRILVRHNYLFCTVKMRKAEYMRAGERSGTEKVPFCVECVMWGRGEKDEDIWRIEFV